MERKDFMSIGEVLRDCIEKSALQGNLEEVRACDAFAGVVGPGFAAQCTRPMMRHGVMTIGVGNASLRSELNMHRSRIAAAINDAMGKEIVKDLVFRS